MIQKNKPTENRSFHNSNCGASCPEETTAPKGGKLSSLRPVNGQRLCEYTNVPFGWFHIGYNGCVVLAIYNALLLTGYQKDLQEIRRCLHRIWKPRIFGVRQWEISRSLKTLEIPYASFSSVSELRSAMKPGDVAIVLSWNRTIPFCHFTMGEAPLSVLRFPDPFGGAHGMALEYTQKGTWKVYNRYSNRDKTYEYQTFEEFLPYNALFVKGFLIPPSP